MNDIDFDEIDRAVSSVTNGDTVRDTVGNTLESASVIPTVESESAVPSPAARRSGGRFMDVVHPSSDMRSPAPTAPSLRREEVVVRERTTVTARPEPAAISSSAFHWPDPVARVEPVVVESPVSSIPEAVPATIDVPAVTEEVSPLESPFLSDAKVEKRPLGAFSTSGPDSDLELIDDFPAPSFSQQSQTAETPKADEIDTDTDIPAELQEDVLLLEAHSEPEDKTEDTPEVVTTEPATETTTTPALVGLTSITQQYKEQPSTASQPSGSIYDTEAYHQALTHPAKKRSSAMIIIWIVALILVGGGIGTAIYFVVLPMLH